MKHRTVKLSQAFGCMLFSMCFLLSCATMSTEEKIQHHTTKGNEYYTSGNYEDAKRELQSVIDLDPNNTDAHYRLGVIHFREGHAQQAQAAFTQVISLDPAYAKAYYNLGVLYSSGGSLHSTEKARIAFTKYLELAPTSSNRGQIEKWMKENTPQPKVKSKPVTPRKASPAPTPKQTPQKEESAPTDFKEWLKQQSGQIE